MVALEVESAYVRVHPYRVANTRASGVIDLRITSAGWTQAKPHYGGDPAVHHEPSRRNWIEIHLGSRTDLDRLRDALAIAVAANA